MKDKEVLETLMEKWKYDTNYISDPTKIMQSVYAKQLVKNCKKDSFIKQIIKSLKKEPSFLVFILDIHFEEISCPKKYSGNIVEMSNFWINRLSD